MSRPLDLARPRAYAHGGRDLIVGEPLGVDGAPAPVPAQVTRRQDRLAHAISHAARAAPTSSPGGTKRRMLCVDATSKAASAITRWPVDAPLARPPSTRMFGGSPRITVAIRPAELQPAAAAATPGARPALPAPSRSAASSRRSSRLEREQGAERARGDAASQAVGVEQRSMPTGAWRSAACRASAPSTRRPRPAARDRAWRAAPAPRDSPGRQARSGWPARASPSRDRGARAARGARGAPRRRPARRAARTAWISVSKPPVSATGGSASSRPGSTEDLAQ